MTCDEAFIWLCESFWILSNAIDRAVNAAVADVPDQMATQVAAEVRAECYPEEKRIWEEAYVRVMSAMARADIAAGFEPFTPWSQRVDAPVQGALF